MNVVATKTAETKGVLPKAEATLEWSLKVDCPHCQHENDLSVGSHDDDGVISTPIFNNDWAKLNGRPVVCEKCEKEFIISEVVY